MSGSDSGRVLIPSSAVEFGPSEIVRRRFVAWRGIQGEAFEIERLEQFEYAVTSPHHMLIISERAERNRDESVVEGYQKSTLREFNRKLSFVPAGHRFYGWQDPRVPWRGAYLYIDPAGPLLDAKWRFHEIEFQPRLFFFDRDIWETAGKLKKQIHNPESSGYPEALSLVLAHELVRLNRVGGKPGERLSESVRAPGPPCIAHRKRDSPHSSLDGPHQPGK